ncbi:hypothetical protein Tco_0210394 [Tanacetum coccineum]
MESVSFPPSPPLIGTLEKQNLNKFYDYHGVGVHNTNDCYHLKKQLEEVAASGKLAYLVKDIRRGNQRNRSQGRGEEIAFSMIPRNSLTDAPIILEETIEGYHVRRIYIDCRSSSEIMQNIPSLGIGRPHSDYGRTRKEQNCAIKVCHSKVPLTLQCDNGKNRNDKIQSGMQTDRGNVKFMEGNTVALAYGTNIQNKGTSNNGARSIPDQRPGKEPMIFEEAWKKDTLKEK